MPNNPCWLCKGTGYSAVVITKCEKVDIGRFCDYHFQHFDYRRCWLCFGSRRMDVISSFFVNTWRGLKLYAKGIGEAGP